MTDRTSAHKKRPNPSTNQSSTAAGTRTSNKQQAVVPPPTGQSSTTADSSTSSSALENPGEPAVSPQLTAACSALVEKYRAGEAEKIDTLFGIQAILDRHAVGEEGQAEHIKQALKSYIRMLNNYDALRTSALGRASHTLGASGASDAGSDDGDQRGLSGDDISPTAGALVRSKRAKSPTLDEEDDSMHYKRRIDPGCFPWIIRETLEPTPLSPELRQTQRLLDNFLRDIKFTKSSLLNSPGLPQFPDAEWANLLTGKSVNFDHVYTSIYSASADDRKRERLGSVEIVVGSSGTPAKIVESEAAWSTSYNIFVEAALYVFPHRAKELEAYGKFIRWLFTSLTSNRHLRIIAYDKACRICVSQRRDLLLSDTAEFIDLQLLWLNESGRGNTRDAARPAKSSNSGTRTRRAICRRFNAASGM